MQVARLFEIVYILISKKKITAKELSERLEVSKRTILRDIETLSMAGLPIYTIRGKNGGIAIMDGYLLNEALFSDDEKNNIMFALQSLSRMQYASGDGTINKLAAIFKTEAVDWIHIDFSRWNHAYSDGDRFAILKEAIFTKRSVEFSYFGANSTIERRSAYPIRFEFKQRDWYVRAFCNLRSDYRTFKISRIIGPIIEEGSETSNIFNVTGEMGEEMSPDKNFIDIVVDFDGDSAHMLFDEFAPEDISEKPDGWFRVAATVPDDDWLKRFILSFGKRAKIISPKRISDDVMRLARELLDSYENNSD